MRDTPPAHAQNLGSFSASRQFFEECLASVDLTRETLWVAHVDAMGNCLHLASYDGDEASAPCPTHDILADILAHGTVGILLAHNHPNGLRHPSMGDLRVTQALATDAEAAHCAILDHLIFAGAECFSLRQAGLICWLEPAMLRRIAQGRGKSNDL
jgi:DNA repair protein RadC